LDNAIHRGGMIRFTPELLRLLVGQLSDQWIARATHILTNLTSENGSMTEHDFRLALDRAWFEETNVTKRNWPRWPCGPGARTVIGPTTAAGGRCRIARGERALIGVARRMWWQEWSLRALAIGGC
jgi:hypothetical protein